MYKRQPIYREKVLDIVIKWSILPNGLIKSEIDAVKNVNSPFLPRFGVEVKLDKSYENLSYFGLGPYENYQDKHYASYLGRFNTSVSKIHEDYIRPQENGSRSLCKEVEIYNENLSIYVASQLSLIHISLLIKTEDEVIKEKVGMRVISVEDSVLKLNGVNVKLRGVNPVSYTQLDVYKRQTPI